MKGVDSKVPVSKQQSSIVSASYRIILVHCNIVSLNQDLLSTVTNLCNLKIWKNLKIYPISFAFNSNEITKW